MRRTLLFALLLGTATSSEIAAQDAARRRPTRVPVSVVVVDTLSAESGFRILRRADSDPRDVILLREDADAVTLTEAVDHLLLLRRAQGDTARTTGMLRVQRARPDRPGGPRVLPWARRVLDALRGAPREDLLGVGYVPALVIWLPAQGAGRAVQN